jgi:DNA-directed RNA polymerase alpha subunit
MDIKKLVDILTPEEKAELFSILRDDVNVNPETAKSYADNEIRKELHKKLDMKISDIFCGRTGDMRILNVLHSCEIIQIGDLVAEYSGSITKFRRFGKQSLIYVNKRLEELGLCLEMDTMGWQPKLCKNCYYNFISASKLVGCRCIYGEGAVSVSENYTCNNFKPKQP